jgi:two-component system, NtrC family, response regulator AtoC
MKTILIIDDDMVVITLLKGFLIKSGYAVSTATNGDDGLRVARLKNPDLVITDYEMPGISGLELVQELVKLYPGLPVIMLTCHSDVSLTIQSIQAGAYDYIEKPIQPQKMLEAIRNGLEVAEQRNRIGGKVSLPVRKIIEDNILAGKTPRIRDIVKNIGRISMTRMHVIIQGESGTGKNQLANLIHYSGITRDDPMVVLHCDAIDPEGIEEELFGFHTSAYDKKRRSKTGLLSAAGEGTLLINEFQLLPLRIQQILSRVIEDKKIPIPGMSEHIPFNARIIACTHQDAEGLVKSGAILRELYYHLKIFFIDLPPLRLRLDDIEALIEHFLDKLNRKLAKHVTRLEEGTLELLMSHSWAGNIRELENAISQALILSRGDVLEKEHIRMYLHDAPVQTTTSRLDGSLESIERRYILQVLEEVSWRKGEATRILGISRPTLNAKIERYNLKETL